MYVCVCTCVCVGGYAVVYDYEEARVDMGCPSLCLLYSLVIGALPEAGVMQAASKQFLCLHSSQYWGHRYMLLYPTFYMGTGWLLAIEPSSQYPSLFC